MKKMIFFLFNVFVLLINPCYPQMRRAASPATRTLKQFRTTRNKSLSSISTQDSDKNDAKLLELGESEDEEAKGVVSLPIKIDLPQRRFRENACQPPNSGLFLCSTFELFYPQLVVI